MIYTWFTTFMASFAIFPGAPHLYSNSILAPDSGVDATEVGEYLRSTTLHNTSHISHEFIWYLVRLYNKCISIIGVYPISSLLYIYIQNIYIYRIYIYIHIYIYIFYIFLWVFSMLPTEVTFCATGIFFLESSQLLPVTSVSMQPNLMAKASICLLMGAAWLGHSNFKQSHESMRKIWQANLWVTGGMYIYIYVM